MINGKILKFGYGDIAVSPNGFTMTFIPFKPPVEVGTNTRPLFANGDIQRIGEPVSIKFDDFKDFAELRKKLEVARFEETSRVFEFKGYTFDFSNYNEKSIDVCEGNLNYIYRTFLSCAAC